MSLIIKMKQSAVGAITLWALLNSAIAKNTPPTYYSFNDSETVPVTLSSVDINRLVVKNDKITSIDCPEGFCIVTGTKTDVSGAARLSLNLAAPFTAYISTEKGRHFGLFITPKAKPAVTSIFTAKYDPEARPSVFDKRAPYTSMMSDFTAQMMRYLATGERINGYQVQIITHTKEKVTATGLTTEVAVVFTGRHFNGIIYRLTNHSPEKIDLTTTQFYSPTIRAAALSTTTLQSQQVGHLFVISGWETVR